MQAISVPPSWVRITDPELIWMALVKAKAGQRITWFGGTSFARAWESGGLDLFDRSCRAVQKSLACWIKSQRFVVVWRPQEPTRPPEIYHDTREAK